ncbi:MAG: GntR family transcriptional regulator, partial [Porticoccaceae bacterium]|nr:GntR family transcriptional regulator [Porticoccaceae bacterium]
YMRAATRIAEFISKGNLKPGDKLPPERNLAKILNVSRPTVREAIIALELSGLIEVKMGSGVYLKQNKPNLVLMDKGIGPFEVLELRRILEPEVAALAANRITKTQLKRLEKILSEMKNQNDTPAMQNSDKNFHIYIAEVVANTAISGTIRWLWEIRERTELTRVFHERILQEGIFPLLEQHEIIFSALSVGDTDLARQSMSDHLESATKNASNYFT